MSHLTLKEIEKEIDEMFIVGNIKFSGLANDKLTPEKLKSFFLSRFTSTLQEILEEIEKEKKDCACRVLVTSCAEKHTYNQGLKTAIEIIKKYE